MTQFLLALSLAIGLALAENADAADLRLIRIDDCETFTGLDAKNRQVKVRLHGIAPRGPNRLSAPSPGRPSPNGGSVAIKWQ